MAGTRETVPSRQVSIVLTKPSPGLTKRPTQLARALQIVLCLPMGLALLAVTILTQWWGHLLAALELKPTVARTVLQALHGLPGREWRETVLPAAIS